MPGRPSRSDTTTPLFGQIAAQPAPRPGTMPTITAHCDGGARGNPGPAGFGVEITNPAGDVLAELSEFLGVCTNNVAEYSGLLASLQFALEHGHSRLRVVSDSELMVKQIQGKYKVNSPDLKPLWLKAKERIAKLDSFEITHALRHKNKAADRLANEAMDRGMRRGTPAEGRPVVRADSGVAGVLPHEVRPYPRVGDAPPAPARLDPSPRTVVPTTEATSPTENPTLESRTGMLRGFTRDGVVHLLGGRTIPDGVFVKVILE